MAENDTTAEREGSGDSSSYDSLIQAEIGLSKQQTELARQQAKDTKPYYESVLSAADESARIAKESKPTYVLPPKPPSVVEMTQPSNLQKTFGIASIFALLAAGITKDRTMAGINGLVGFIQGARAGNIEQAQAALTDFNNNFKWAHETNTIIQQQYYDILNSSKLTLEAKEQALRLKMLENKDEALALQVEQNGIGNIFKQLENRDKANHQMFLENMSMRRLSAQIEHWRTSGTGGAGGADSIFGIPMSQIPTVEPGQKNEAFLKMLPPATAQLIKDMAAGKLPVSGFGGFDVKTRSNLVKGAAIYDPGGFDARTYAVGAKALTELTPGGPVGTNVLAINTMVHHIDQFARDFSMLDNSQVQKWNATKNKLSAQFGDPSLGVVQQDAMRVSDEYAKIVKGGRASPTEQDMRLWERLFSADLAPGQMRAAVWDALEGAGGRLKALQDAYADYPGAAEKMLSPETKSIIAKWKPKNVASPSWLGAEAKTPSGKKALTIEAAKDFLKQAGGDRIKAQKMAIDAGYEWK